MCFYLFNISTFNEMTEMNQVKYMIHMIYKNEL